MDKYFDTKYSLNADPCKTIREQGEEILRLKRTIEEMRANHTRINDELITERNVYLNLVLKILKIKD